MHGSYIHGSRCDHKVIKYGKKEKNEQGLNSGVFQQLQKGGQRSKGNGEGMKGNQENAATQMPNGKKKCVCC